MIIELYDSTCNVTKEATACCSVARDSNGDIRLTPKLMLIDSPETTLLMIALSSLGHILALRPNLF